MARTPDFRPSGIGAILDTAIAVIRSNWRRLLAITAIVVLPFAAAYSIVSSFYLRTAFELLGTVLRDAQTGAAPPNTDASFGLLYSLVSAMGLLYWLSRLYFTSTLYAAAGSLMEGKPPGVRDMLKAGGRSFFPLLAVDIAISLFIVPFAAVVTFPLLGLGGVVAWVFLSMAAPIVVIEGGIASAFSRSAALVRRHFWRVLVIVVGAYLVAGQFESALATPALLREVVLGAQGQSALTSQLAWGWKLFDGMIQGIAIAATLPFLQLAILLCYLDLRAREEGMDLIIRARALLSPER